VSKKLLIIEDDEDLASMLAFQASIRNIKTSIASSIDEGYASLNKSLPDWILLDLRLPEGHGFMFISKIKKQKHLGWANIPIIIYSALDDLKTIQSAFILGADEFVPKPGRLSELFAHFKAV